MLRIFLFREIKMHFTCIIASYNGKCKTKMNPMTTNLAAPYTHYSLRSLWSANIPSEVIIKLSRIRESRKWIIIIHLYGKHHKYTIKIT